MHKADRGVRGSRSRAARSRALRRRRAGAPSDRLAQQGARDPRQLLAHILETPHLARAVPRLPPVVLHRLIQSCGLEDCAALVALATPGQLSGVFDLDLWRSVQPGMEEEFDAARFAVWLEVLAESGTALAAHKLAGIDMAVVVAALTQYVRVFDPAVVDGADTVIPTALKDAHHTEIGGYIVAAKRTDFWDAIIGVLVALGEEHPDRFHHVMQACRTLSNSKPEIDGLDDLLADSEQVLFDLAFDREQRREKLGYVAAAQARAFLQSSRQVRLAHDGTPHPNPLPIAYFRVVDGADAPIEYGTSSESGERSPSEPHASTVAAVVDVLLDAGILHDGSRALLGSAEEHADTERLARIQALMQFVRDHDPAAYSLRTQELAFLANVIVAGGSIQGRPFTTGEALDAAVATCNLALENWPLHRLRHQSRPSLPAIETAPTLPEDFLANHDLATVFQVGWTVLHKEVCIFVTKQLLGTLDGLECSDREIQLGLYKLRREMTRHLEAGAPWLARDALDVIAMLDMPAWAALLGLIAECPVMLANVGASGPSRPHSVSPTVFAFVSENRHIMAVREFMQSLPDLLSG